MEFSKAINENGFLYVPYAEVKDQEELKRELEIYKKALELTCKDIAEIDIEYHGIFANDRDYWVNLYLKKARQE